MYVRWICYVRNRKKRQKALHKEGLHGAKIYFDSKAVMPVHFTD